MTRAHSTKDFPSPEGGLRTIRKTELEKNKGILKNPLYTLHKGSKRHNICTGRPNENEAVACCFTHSKNSEKSNSVVEGSWPLLNKIFQLIK